MENNLKKLPIGIQYFEEIRAGDYIYVDKTQQLLQLIQNGKSYFLSRPRRFGKTLAISTLKAMFEGKSNLFHGLACEQWVREQQMHPSPIISLDMSGLREFNDEQSLQFSLVKNLDKFVNLNHIDAEKEDIPSGYIENIITNLYKKYGKVVLLIDEYDKIILDNINNADKIEFIRKTLHSFYSMIKSCDSLLKFTFIIGISKFSKIGIFSSMNNLNDISVSSSCGSIADILRMKSKSIFITG